MKYLTVKCMSDMLVTGFFYQGSFNWDPQLVMQILGVFFVSLCLGGYLFLATTVQSFPVKILPRISQGRPRLQGT